MANNEVYRNEQKPSVNHSYFYMPPAWIGSTPGTLELRHPNSNLVKVVCSRQLPVGIRIDAHRDGVFTFDFTGWPEGRPITIPAYTEVGGQRLPEHILEARKLAEQHRYQCMSVMNAHLACLSTAMSRAQGLGVAVRQVITPSAYFTTHWQGNRRVLLGIEPNDPVLAYVAAHFRLDPDIQGKRTRIVIQLDTVKHSFDLLDKILTSAVPDALLLTKLIYLAATNYYEHDFPTALTLSWTVCEKLLRIIWDSYIASSHAPIGAAGKPKERINKERKKMLTGRDFTASVMSEVLELAGPLKHEIYRKLSEVRRRRNAWLHSMEPISGMIAREGIRAAELFFKEVSQIELDVHLSYSARL